MSRYLFYAITTILLLLSKNQKTRLKRKYKIFVFSLGLYNFFSLKNISARKKNIGFVFLWEKILRTTTR